MNWAMAAASWQPFEVKEGTLEVQAQDPPGELGALDGFGKGCLVCRQGGGDGGTTAAQPVARRPRSADRALLTLSTALGCLCR